MSLVQPYYRPLAGNSADNLFKSDRISAASGSLFEFNAAVGTIPTELTDERIPR